ncbi:phosphoribosylpyrophosphate synthetase [Hyphobacterium sp. CCMP332]|nr:phosphoribosylpyrophosphate synthetase [Hyphobacterium sp. CCMP332]
MENYDTLSMAMNALKERGFTIEFSTEKSHIISIDKDLKYEPEDFDIVEIHRFEGMTNPGDMSVLYAIESKDGKKGLLVDAYGAYASEISPELAKKLGANS